MPFRRCVDIGEQTVGNLLGGGFHRVPRKAGIAGGRLWLQVAEEPADHGAVEKTRQS